MTSRALLVLAATLSTTIAVGQENRDEIVRRDLIAQAERAHLAGDHAQAVERAERAAQIRATPSVQHFLAREYDALGRSLAALEAAGACARGAEADAALRNRDALLRECRAIVASVESRIGRLTVRVAAPLPEGATVRVAGASLTAAVLGVPYPVEPGSVRVEASAPGYDAWVREVPIAAGESRAVDVTLLLTPPPPPPPPVVVARLAAVGEPRPAPPPPSRSAVGLVVGGAVGAASFVAAGVFFAVAASAQSERDAACHGVPLTCDSSARDDDARYRGFLHGGDAAVIAGGAALVAGGLVWWFMRPAARARAAEVPRVVVIPTFGGRAGAGASLVISL